MGSSIAGRECARQWQRSQSSPWRRSLASLKPAERRRGTAPGRVARARDSGQAGVVTAAAARSLFRLLRDLSARRALPSTGTTLQSKRQAEVAQLVEQLIRNQQVVGSSPTFGSIKSNTYGPRSRALFFGVRTVSTKNLRDRCCSLCDGELVRPAIVPSSWTIWFELNR